MTSVVLQNVLRM